MLKLPKCVSETPGLTLTHICSMPDYIFVIFGTQSAYFSHNVQTKLLFIIINGPQLLSLHYLLALKPFDLRQLNRYINGNLTLGNLDYVFHVGQMSNDVL